METLERTPPHSIDAEVCVLGSMILDATTIPSVRDILSPSDFYRLAHQIIFRALTVLADTGAPVDLVTVRDALDQAGTLGEVGGIEYVADLVDGVPNAANAGYYAAVVKAKSTLRRLIAVGAGLVNAAYDPGTAPGEVLEVLQDAQQGLYDLAVGHQGKSGQIMAVGDAAKMVLKDSVDALRMKRPPGLQTGIEAWDSATCGIAPTDYIVVGAVTGSGKTTFALCHLTGRVCRAGGGVVYFSCEMWPRLLTQRILQDRADMLRWRLERGEMDKAQWNQLKRAEEELSGWKLELVGRASTLGEIGSRARSAATRWQRLDLIVVDYLQHMRGPGRDTRERVQLISNGLKELATTMGVPVLALAQFTRSVGKEQRKPVIYDLKESGDIENDADVVVLLHQEVPPVKGPIPFSAEAALDDRPEAQWEEVWGRIAKNRSGPNTPWPDEASAGVKSIKFRWYRNVTRFQPVET